MGYTSQAFQECSALAPPGASILDLGSQDITRDDGTIAPVAEAWRSGGFTYTCVDVDERPGTKWVDLQSLAFPPELRARFDLVANHGTTEHLANPIGGFALMHYACRPGGIMFHDVPLFGWGNHGLMNATPKFWMLLGKLNGYEMLSAAARPCAEPAGDLNFYDHDRLGRITGLADARGLSWMMRAVFRKPPQRDYAFVPPFDVVLPRSDGTREARMVLGSLLPFAHAGVWSEEEILVAVDAAMAAIGKPYRADALPRIVQTIGWATRYLKRRLTQG